jgi:thiamine biosynthesis lipoprotein
VRPFAHDEQVMGTVVSFGIWAPSPPADRQLVGLSRALAVLQRIDAVFSTYRPESPVSLLRRGEVGINDVPQQVRTVLDCCARAKELTDGWFDPWAMPGGVDPTGLVKGWAVERAVEELASAGVTAATVNAGGDIATLGSPEGEEPWRFGIRHPFDAGQIATVVEVRSAIATSATYERGNHLIDPHSGAAVSPVASASVVGDSLAMADALATALAVRGEDGLAFVEQAGYEGLVITPDGRFLSTPRFPFAPHPTVGHLTSEPAAPDRQPTD